MLLPDSQESPYISRSLNLTFEDCLKDKVIHTHYSTSIQFQYINYYYERCGMRLKVEIQWQGQPWGRRTQVQKLSLIDGIFGILVAIIYIVKIVFPDLEPDYPYFTPRERMNVQLTLLFLISANLIQAFHAFRLCYVVSKTEGREPPECHRTAKIWFDFTEFSYLFTVVKCIATVGFVIKVAPHPWVLVLVALTLPECIYKIYELYVVHSFMEDLRKSLQYLPKFRFIPLPYSIGFINKAADYDFKLNGDVNANTQLIA